MSGRARELDDHLGGFPIEIGGDEGRAANSHDDTIDEVGLVSVDFQHASAAVRPVRQLI